jgi:hypothetical protein
MARGREADYSSQSSAEVKRALSYTSTPPYVFMVWCLVKYRYEGVSKVFVLASRSENCKWYSSLPLGAVVPLFYESV